MDSKFFIGVFTLLLLSCGSGEEKNSTCKVENVVMNCDSADVYNQFMEKEEAINALFKEESTTISPEERLEMRKDLVTYYSNQKTTIDAVYQLLIKKSSSALFDPAEIDKMRQEELALLENKQSSLEEVQSFLNELDYSTYVSDTVFNDYAGVKSYHIIKINNTSDKTISSFLVSQNEIIDGVLHYEMTPTTVLFLPDQIQPVPEDLSSMAVLEPGQTIFLPFETSDQKTAQPEIIGIDFVD